jgi:hypothetical protein
VHTIEHDKPPRLVNVFACLTVRRCASFRPGLAWRKLPGSLSLTVDHPATKTHHTGTGTGGRGKKKIRGGGASRPRSIRGKKHRRVCTGPGRVEVELLGDPIFPERIKLVLQMLMAIPAIKMQEACLYHDDPTTRDNICMS